MGEQIFFGTQCTQLRSLKERTAIGYTDIPERLPIHIGSITNSIFSLYALLKSKKMVFLICTQCAREASLLPNASWYRE